MGYQYIGEDDRVFKVRHPDGSEFHVAKNSVGESVHKKIKSLKAIQMADGGVVSDSMDENSLPERAEDSLGQSLQDWLGVKTRDDSTLPPTPIAIPVPTPVAVPVEQVSTQAPPKYPAMPEIPQQPTTPITPERTPATTPPLPQPASTTTAQLPGNIDQQAKLLAEGFALRESGIKGMAEAESAGLKEQAAIRQRQAEQEQKIVAQYEIDRKALEFERQQIKDAILNEKIDPNRFFSNMSTGNKILAAIGVALSGIGAGLQGGGAPNMAVNILQKSIDRDIEAQKAELGKKQSLLSENLRRTGDLNSAVQMTRLQMNAVAEAQIAQIAAKSGSVQATQKAKLLLSAAGIEAAALIQKTLQDRPVNAQTLSRMTDDQVLSLPEEKRKNLVKVGGKWTQAIDENSAKEARKIIGANDAMLSNLDKLIALREKYGSETLPGTVKAEMQTIASSLQLALKEAKQLGTLDKGAERFLEKLVADPTSIGFVSDQYKALKATQNLETKSRLKSLGVDTSNLDLREQFKAKEGKPKL